MSSTDLQSWWPIIAFVLTAVGGCVVFIVQLWRRVDRAEQAHSAHEDLCAQRWVAAKDSAAHLAKLTDERHSENVDRFDRLEDKLDRLLERA